MGVCVVSREVNEQASKFHEARDFLSCYHILNTGSMLAHRNH
jgi:hypothetical protein